MDTQTTTHTLPKGLLYLKRFFYFIAIISFLGAIAFFIGAFGDTEYRNYFLGASLGFLINTIAQIFGIIAVKKRNKAGYYIVSIVYIILILISIMSLIAGEGDPVATVFRIILEGTLVWYLWAKRPYFQHREESLPTEKKEKINHIEKVFPKIFLALIWIGALLVVVRLVQVLQA